MTDEEYLNKLLREAEMIEKNRILYFLNVAAPFTIFFAFLFLVLYVAIVFFHGSKVFEMYN